MIHAFMLTTTPELAQVGGKGRSLIEATAANLPVPDGFVLGVDFFGPWMDRVEQSSAWAAFAQAPQDELRTHCEAVKTFCAGLELTPEQRRALDEAMQGLPGDGLFAVRSSSPEEDLDGSSFAGGYETTLGVTRDGLENAIRHSFTSVFDERVVQYKRQRGHVRGTCRALPSSMQTADRFGGERRRVLAEPAEQLLRRGGHQLELRPR